MCAGFCLPRELICFFAFYINWVHFFNPPAPNMSSDFFLAATAMSGLSVWPGVEGLELHALLSEAPAAGDFGRPKRELFHRPMVA